MVGSNLLVRKVPLDQGHMGEVCSEDYWLHGALWGLDGSLGHGDTLREEDLRWEDIGADVVDSVGEFVAAAAAHSERPDLMVGPVGSHMSPTSCYGCTHSGRNTIVGGAFQNHNPVSLRTFPLNRWIPRYRTSFPTAEVSFALEGQSALAYGACLAGRKSFSTVAVDSPVLRQNRTDRLRVQAIHPGR